MRKAVIVIGCSYGDEGKGLAAVYSAKRLGGRCLNILINGGAQRGHTVDLPDGRRHIFRHFGSASMVGAVSCADEDYMVNPMLFVQEQQELLLDFDLSPRLMVSGRCRVTLPWDMMLGQIIEENRGSARHGSCGCGIYETKLRFETTDWALRFGELVSLSADEFIKYCRRVAEEYLPARLQALGVTPGPAWEPILKDEGIFLNFWEDVCTMRSSTEIYFDWKKAAEPFDTLVFEAGQGLALDAENIRDFPYLTPSRTTSLISARRIAALSGETDSEIFYVTRSYLTRHGPGPFPTECSKDSINPDMIDRTNVPNPHQLSLRYGMFDGESVLKRVRQDLETTRSVLPDVKSAVMVTHLNETSNRLTGAMCLEEFIASFDSFFLSDCPCFANIREEAVCKAGEAPAPSQPAQSKKHLENKGLFK